eukprot:gene31923-36042_t
MRAGRLDAGYAERAAAFNWEALFHLCPALFRSFADMLAQAAFDPYRGAEIQPGPQVQSDNEIRDFIRRKAETIYHPVGTCKMGHDAMAVVDDTLAVHGLQGLRVADASI